MLNLSLVIQKNTNRKRIRQKYDDFVKNTLAEFVSKTLLNIETKIFVLIMLIL